MATSYSWCNLRATRTLCLYIIKCNIRTCQHSYNVFVFSRWLFNDISEWKQKIVITCIEHVGLLFGTQSLNKIIFIVMSSLVCFSMENFVSRERSLFQGRISLPKWPIHRPISFKASSVNIILFQVRTGPYRPYECQYLYNINLSFPILTILSKRRPTLAHRWNRGSDQPLSSRAATFGLDGRDFPSQGKAVLWIEWSWLIR